ncbi:SDR family NAD(P)-dependent oxidoreductase [Streptomyces sioyaensis]|uniref:SDR family NAD(P)-dependent oxidoreductase n=1 Tax=Streptomyces sioyaensis TaxID=67364 RepID=UPI0036AEB1BD
MTQNDRPATTPVAIVFGGSSGIGAETARRFAAAGHRVAIVGSRPRTEVEGLMAEVPDGLYLQADLSLTGSPASVVEAVLTAWGRVDAVVYSAGATVRIPHSDLTAVTDEVWERILLMNLRVPWRVIQAVEPALRKSGDGSITIVGALAGVDVGGSSIPYAVSKAAVHHMCKLLGGVLGPEIRINAVAPGLIDTPWTEGWDALRSTVVKTAPLARTGTPRDVADVVLGFASSRYVTGQVVVVDGGLSLVP